MVRTRAKSIGDFNPCTGALSFNRLSIWNPNTHDYDGANVREILSHVYRSLEADNVRICGPFLIINEDIPLKHCRPFTIGGALAIWIRRDDPLPRELMIGTLGTGSIAALETHVATDLVKYVLPKAGTLNGLWRNLFPDADAVSFVNSGIVVEFPKMDAKSFMKRLREMPAKFANSETTLEYVNGPFVPENDSRETCKGVANELTSGASPRNMLRSEEIKYRDVFVVEGSAPLRRLICFGKRLRRASEPSIRGPVTQMIYASNVPTPSLGSEEPELALPLPIRRIQTVEGDHIAENGEIAGFVSGNGSENSSTTLPYLRFVDALPL